MIVIVDYGMGNLRSVFNALESLGAGVKISSDPHDLTTAKKLVLPGVGAFPSAMRELAARHLVEPVKTAIARGIPYLGICLGLQLLFDSSEEGEGAAGFGVLHGTVKRLNVPRSLKIPHIGWNQVDRHETADTRRQEPCPLLRDIPAGSFFYFVHSYYVDPVEPLVTSLETDYGGRFPAMVWSKNIFATQFHPEKSQSVGLHLLKNFINL